MGKKGSWFSTIKRVFTHNSKEKPTNGSDKKNSKEKKKGKGILSHSETKSFIPLFREPSSIEKILGEADQLLVRHPTSERPKTPPTLIERPTSPPRISSPNVSSHRASSPNVISSPKPLSPKPVMPGATSSKSNAPEVTQSQEEISYVQRPEPTLRNQHLSATKIQAAYRGYVARRSFRALRGLVRLQGIVRGQNVKRQTANAMKQMQLLVRVQTQIQSRRIQMLESQALQHQAHRNDKEAESTLSKWTHLSEAANNEDWDDSSLTKEEVEARLLKKVEAVKKRERAMAYAYSNQLWKSNPRSAQNTLDIRSNGYPWWWNWLERQLPPTTTTTQTQTVPKNIHSTPPRPISEYKASPRLNYNQEVLTPRSSKSVITARAKQFHTPTRTPTPGSSSSSHIKYSYRTKASPANSAYDVMLKDDDSLMSCPPFSVPNYMTPTVSAKAKVRANSNPKERLIQGSDSKRRYSFPLTPNIGPFKWGKGSSNKDSVASQVLEKHRSTNSIGDVSIDSAVSMPAVVGRKPFNRFV